MPFEGLAELDAQRGVLVEAEVLVRLLLVEARLAVGVPPVHRLEASRAVLHAVAGDLLGEHRGDLVARPFDEIAADDHGESDPVGQFLGVVEQVGAELGELRAQDVGRWLLGVARVVDDEDVALALELLDRRRVQR